VALEASAGTGKTRVLVDRYVNLLRSGVDPGNITMSVDPAQHTVTVTVDGSINYTFARVFGQTTGHVHGAAVAKVATVSGYNNVVPLGVVQSDWKLGSPVTLKAAPGGGGFLSPGDFGALSLGGTGAATYENNLRNGYTGWIRVGDLLPTEPGNVAGPTHRAVQARIDLDPYATWATVRKGSPRIVILPVLESFDINGRGEVKVVGFGAFFLEQVNNQGNNLGDVSGRFLRYVVVGESTGTVSDFAAYTIKLTH
jgi:hypothetical protein